MGVSAAEDHDPKLEVETNGLPSLKILLAEDNYVNQTLAIGLLNRLGHQVIAVSDGKAAVEAVIANHLISF
ncbi:MAG: hypothetical protein R3C05_01740 [Pirellulaceae bacterium]